MIIGDLVGRRAQLTPDKVALIDSLNGYRRITYAEWAESINRTANWLWHGLGVRPGDRVAVLAMNCVEYLDVWLACGRIGAILQNLNWRLAAGELHSLLADAEPAVLIYGPDFLDRVSFFRARPLPSLRHWVALGETAASGDRPFQERDDFSPSSPPPLSLSWDDPWVICYTGGTTGLPKGALLTHRAMVFNAINTHTSWGLAAGDTAILNAPLFHTGGLNVFTLPLIVAGGASVVCRTFDPDQVFDLVAGGGVTLFFGVPTMFIMLQQHPRWETADFSRLKLVISGGAPCPLPVFEKFWAKGVDFKTGYGLTEAGPNTFWLPPADVRLKPGYVGLPLMFVDVKVVRPDGSECEPGEAGELIIHGPHVCAGYWRNLEATAAAIHPTPADPSGRAWLHTGDVAVRDAEGYYRIAGRLKEMFISGGENVYPAEIESVLHSHPAVAGAAVIAVPDDKWGEVGRAVVVLAAGQTATAEELIAFCRGRLAGYKVPRSAVFVDELPMTGAGKIDKKLLESRYG
ncbi:MAG: long-chain fatty acid--CoA ligase [Chloroflexi bacterium]|nr:long-chain fatty acid--CoA ligase [Chloroflexota bacterium]MCI0575137.1 long-chain fatty acid--CoA ligase [Chloroflexota bacterium]MCI0646286.1 long-chain fatty acid--CoA ligase [Chloroflexota bacterium]MCI0728631.1 long-chain fatty acid--CoA ligase [Chloroflexota bacterium]